MLLLALPFFNKYFINIFTESLCVHIVVSQCAGTIQASNQHAIMVRPIIRHTGMIPSASIVPP